MLIAGFIKPNEEATWLSPTVVVPKKNGKLIICVDFKKFNVDTKKDPSPLHFINEVINTIVGHEVYTFLDGYPRYHQISIVPEDQYKTAFVNDWGVFVWVVMPFGVKNGPPTYQKVITKAFHEYINVFMKIFLDDFIVFSDLSTHLEKPIKCFLKCIKYGISLNPKKCAFMVCSRTIIGFISFKKGKTLDPKKIEALVKMSVPKTPQEIQVFNGIT